MPINPSNQPLYVRTLMTWSFPGTDDISKARQKVMDFFNITGPFSWTGNSGQTAPVTYSFNNALAAYDGHAIIDGDNIEAIPSSQRQDIRDAMATWANVAKITLSESNSSPNIVIGEASDLNTGFYVDYKRDTTKQGVEQIGVALPVSMTGSQANKVDIVLRDHFGLLSDSGYAPNEKIAYGSSYYFPYETVIHELGHALGLSHPEGSGKSTNYDRSLTIMSYVNKAGVTDAETLIATPMIYDIAAAQYLYGVNTTYLSGNTTYGWKDNIGPKHVVLDGTKKAWTIWDASGDADVLDASSYTAGAVTLDLRGGVDDKGTATLTDDVVRFSEIGDERIAIAFDPASGWTKPIEIESALGGWAANDNHPAFYTKIAC